jgi:ethanolamine ammonia-lyase large subunit
MDLMGPDGRVRELPADAPTTRALLAAAAP